MLGAVAACGPGACASVQTGLSCFPPEAARWLSEVDGEGVRAESALHGADLYVDSSGSMMGYVDGATETRRPFQDLLATIPSLTGGRTSYIAFGTQLRPLASGQEQQLLGRDFYRCARSAPECDNQDTRLDLVLDRIARGRPGAPPGLAIVLTDMWFANPGSATTGLVPLAAPLEAILESGRTIAVFGIPAPFRGTIYDLPGARTAPFQGERPLIMLVIGDGADVRGFGAGLARSPSAFLASSIRDGTMRRSLFSLSPPLSDDHPPSRNPLQGGNDRRVERSTVLEAIEQVQVQQFRISLDRALREAPPGTVPPAWQGPSDRHFSPHAVWRGQLSGRTRVWQRRAERCVAADWLDPAVYEGGWSAADGAQARFTLDPAAFVERFRQAGTYLVSAEVTRVALAQPNPATQWMRNWSFAATDAPGAATRDGGLHRTLHLSEFARLLENSLAEAAERRPLPVTGFTFVVEVVD